ncbi:metal ABC transporter permease [Celerinatantimonas yamalensis]|uniref:Metal ABC transporter permease n=1 Tax=Celerinatantimonas yamalensis TaxID=559956 RepID=A0ABW9G9X4_9GAMM
MFDYSFMRNAWLATTFIALLAGPIGYFLVLRGQSFAGHALAHLGFTGASASLFLGVTPFSGALIATVAGGIIIGFLGNRLEHRDVVIGIVLSLALGLGLLALHFYTQFATQANSLLFGNVLAVSHTMVIRLIVLSCICGVAFLLLARPLLLTTLQPDIAETRGYPVARYSMIFFVLCALVTAACSQIVGALLVFTLMIAPGAAALQLTCRLKQGLILSAAMALTYGLGGISLSYYTDWPISFTITALSSLGYTLTRIYRAVSEH